MAGIGNIMILLHVGTPPGLLADHNSGLGSAWGCSSASSLGMIVLAPSSHASILGDTGSAARTGRGQVRLGPNAEPNQRPALIPTRPR